MRVQDRRYLSYVKDGGVFVYYSDGRLAQSGENSIEQSITLAELKALLAEGVQVTLSAWKWNEQTDSLAWNHVGTVVSMPDNYHHDRFVRQVTGSEWLAQPVEFPVEMVVSWLYYVGVFVSPYYLGEQITTLERVIEKLWRVSPLHVAVRAALQRSGIGGDIGILYVNKGEKESFIVDDRFTANAAFAVNLDDDTVVGMMNEERAWVYMRGTGVDVWPNVEGFAVVLNMPVPAPWLLRSETK